jgi:hypothetical protein
MSSGTITSTTNTFGDIPGTLTGSVGVPGPQGPTGSTGATGATGPAGPAGSPGQGVPVGGTSGQFLQKTSGADYATDWVTVNPFITSVSSPLSVNSGVLSIDLSAYQTTASAASTYQTLAGMSSYLTTSAASATYAVIAAGQPTSGTVGQVLTKNSGASWDSSWQTLIPGDRYLTTSTTSNTVSNGNKTFTIGTGLSYTPTQSITFSYDASNHMHGEVLTYNSGTGVLTVDINHNTGSGTYASWVVNVGGVVPVTSVTWGSITGTLGDQTDLATALNAKLETSTAASTYQTLAGMSSYLTTATAATTYYPLSGNPSAFLVAADIAGKSNLASPTFTGTPLSTTAAADTNTTQLATTAFVVGQAGSATPVVDGTAAVGTSLRYARQDHVHPTDTSRAALASPSLTGTPLSTTAAVDTNTTQIATTAYVVAQAASATPLVDGTAAVGTSLRYARADHVHPTDTSRAALNSPAFTGTPSLPTGTTAVTQTAGDNTTALATTAFVTAAVPAAATIAQSIAATSTTTYLTPSDIPAILSQGMSHRFDAINSTAVSGAGAVTASVGGFRESYTNAASTLGRAAWYAGFAPGSSTILGGLADTRVFNFSKWVYISGRSVTSSGAAGYDGDANSSIRVTFGGYSADAVGNMTQKGIGWKKLGGTGSFVTLCVHNGTTYTEVASTATMTSFQMIEWSIYSDGSGNVTLYINGAQAATTSAGPTGNTTNYYCAYREQVEQTASTATKFALHCYGGSMISQR